jgi:hypothetical protein
LPSPEFWNITSGRSPVSAAPAAIATASPSFTASRNKNRPSSIAALISGFR